MVTTVLPLALGVFVFVEVVKLLVPFRLLPPAKLLVALVLSVPGAVAFGDSFEHGVVIFLGTFGSAPLVHSLHKMLQARGDAQRAETLRPGRR